MVLIIKLLLDSCLLCSWELSGAENWNECGYSSWGVKAGLPKPMACLSAQVPRDFSVTLCSSGGLSLGLPSSLWAGQGGTRDTSAKGNARQSPRGLWRRGRDRETLCKPWLSGTEMVYATLIPPFVCLTPAHTEKQKCFLEG